jgi:hypothetical protein
VARASVRVDPSRPSARKSLCTETSPASGVRKSACLDEGVVLVASARKSADMGALVAARRSTCMDAAWGNTGSMGNMGNARRHSNLLWRGTERGGRGDVHCLSMHYQAAAAHDEQLALRATRHINRYKKHMLDALNPRDLLLQLGLCCNSVPGTPGIGTGGHQASAAAASGGQGMHPRLHPGSADGAAEPRIPVATSSKNAQEHDDQYAGALDRMVEAARGALADAAAAYREQTQDRVPDSDAGTVAPSALPTYRSLRSFQEVSVLIAVDVPCCDRAPRRRTCWRTLHRTQLLP